MVDFTHFNESGRAKMVDVSEKNETARCATAEGTIKMNPETINLIKMGGIKKGDVLATAQIGGIMGAKMTPRIIPMCHNIFISGCDIDFEIKQDAVTARATVKTMARTGVEMEALTAVNVALLTIYDMVKAVDKNMEITQVRLTRKTGGKSDL